MFSSFKEAFLTKREGAKYIGGNQPSCSTYALKYRTWDVSMEYSGLITSEMKPRLMSFNNRRQFELRSSATSSEVQTKKSNLMV